MSKKKILLTIGTRPEVIKVAPLVKALQKSEWAEPVVILTGQHDILLDQQLDIFKFDYFENMNLIEDKPDITQMAAKALNGFSRLFSQFKPDFIVTQGDTTSVAATALAAYYMKIPFGHLEAGLRSFDNHNPFPEEGNRRIASLFADLHFCPTETNRLNLIAEGVSAEKIFVTGNTVIDSLMDVAGYKLPLPFELPENKKIVLVTCHRRDNYGEGVENLVSAIRTLADRHPDLHFIYPVHLNPAIKIPVLGGLGDMSQVQLLDPLDYVTFTSLMARCHLVLTDSGGVQEEAPALGKPVLVFRTATERPEIIERGAAQLVGTDPENVVSAVESLLNPQSAKYLAMAQAGSPYGDGQASAKVMAALEAYFRVDTQPSGTYQKAATAAA
jgi:UDP-N-acetylglucosamine 2-epimerase (non-hydrolysing)